MKKTTKQEWYKAVAEKIMEWGNLVFFSMVLAQTLAKQDINIPVMIVGVIGFIGAYYLARLLMLGGDK